MWHRWNIVETNISSTDFRGQTTHTLVTLISNKIEWDEQDALTS